MTRTRVGLMGFGRVGRDLFRAIYRREDLEIAGIADIADPEALEYLLRFDSRLGRFPDEVSIRSGHLYVRGRQIPFLTGAEVPDWGDLGAQVVIEATARSLGRSQVEEHLARGAERVVLCVPPAEPPDMTVVMGVNDHLLSPEHRVISNGSCTAHCAAPILKILDGAFGVERAFLNSVHAYTNKQRLADVPAEDPRSGRAAAENIIPQETNAAAVIMEILPQLEGRVSGSAMNVPIHNGSVVDLVCWHAKDVTEEAIREVVRTAAASDYEAIVDYVADPIVSSDIEGSPYSSTFDAQATMTLGDRVSKTLSWFDNGWGYVQRVADLLLRLQELPHEASPGEVSS